MSAGKHTPGPWEFGPSHSSTGLAGQLVVRPAGEFPHGEWVADVGSMYDDHREANARLIAAAPELLQVAQVARARIALERDVFVDCNAYPDGSLLQADRSTLDGFNDLLERIDAAISKATDGAA